MSSIVKNVAIVGAGLGGLTTAIALRKQGINVQVYEKAQKFRPAGAGLGIMPNGFNSIEAIEPSLVKAIKSSGCCVTQTTLRNSLGEKIRSNSTDTSFLDKYGHSLVTVWWWNLQQILASFLPQETIHLAHRCIDWRSNRNGVEIYFENGLNARADLLIGADGIRSVVRKKLIASEQPRYLGSFCWRSVVKCEQSFIEKDELVFIRANKQFMYLLNLGDGHISWITRKSTSEYELSASAAETKARVLSEIADWAEPIKAIIEATEAERILEGPICDRLPLKTWSKDRVTLLGDAAHPMSPAMGQGANTAFEDACVLAHCLAHSSSIEAAFTNYEKERVARLEIIQTRSAEGEQRYYQNNTSERQKSRTSEDFKDWLYNYQPNT